jgi:four helix bundle protein
LIIWKAAVELAVDCYAFTKSFPMSETYGMTSQMRRSSTSIAANIAEGHGRENTGSFIQFLRIAQGSLKELETHVTIAERVELMKKVDAVRLLEQADEAGRMIRSMIRKLQSTS